MSFTLYSTTWCGYCQRLKSHLAREDIEFTEIDIERDPESALVVERANRGNQTVPTLVFGDGSSLTNPSVREVKDKLASLAA